jgi:hypothetical protein
MLVASKALFAAQELRVACALVLVTCTPSGTALASQAAQPSQGFREGSSLEVLSRNFYLSNDYRSPSPSGKNYTQEWAQGFITSFESGFTSGAIGFGIDAHGFLGLKLDGGKGHSGTGLLPLD